MKRLRDLKFETQFRIALVIIAVFFTAVIAIFLMFWFTWKDRIEHRELYGFPGEYYYTRVSQIEDVLNENHELIDRVTHAISDQAVGHYSIYPSDLNSYIEADTNSDLYSGVAEEALAAKKIVQENMSELEQIYKELRFNLIQWDVYDDTTVIGYSQTTASTRSEVSLVLRCTVENGEYTYGVRNATAKGHFWVGLYNLIYN